MFPLWEVRPPATRLPRPVKLARANAGARRWAPSTASTIEAPHPQTSPPRAAYVKARINGCIHHCLLDSGADVSLIPTHVIDTRRLNASQPKRLFAANDTEITVDGQITLPITIQERRFQTIFFASENVDEVILGRDWLATNKVIWNFDADRITVDGHPIKLLHKNQIGPRCKRCRVGTELEIPPLSEAIIPTNLIFGNFRKNAHDEQWTTVPSEPISGLRVARTLIPNDSPTVAVRVCNVSRHPIRLYKGQSVSVLQTVKIAAVAPVTTTDDSNAEQQRRSIVQGIDPMVSGETRQQLSELIEKYQDIFSYSEYDLGSTDIVQHEIDTGVQRPFRQALRPQPRAKLPVIDNLINEMQSQGIIEPCQSEWASNIVLVTKKDGSIRFCVDYRKLNSLTQKDAYPLPRIETCLDTLSGAAWFSTFDLRSGFHQVKVNPKDVNKTTFTCHRGTFRFPRMPFGLCNAPATFQRLMDTVLMGLNFDICLAYLDDIIVYSRDLQSHMERLERLFQRLQEANLKLKPSKCSIMQKRVSFLGYIVSESGIGTDPSKIEAVRNWPVPTNLRQSRAFVGLCQYYRRFVPNFSAIAAPLHALTKKGAPFIWTAECQNAFEQLKEALTSADVLALPDDEGHYILDCDASDKAIGAVLSQIQNGEERPICYASQLYDKHQQNYNVTRKELLALVTFVRKFRQYLLGRPFTIRSDHAALQWLRKTPEPIGQQARWLEILEEFDFQVQHRPGTQHSNADSLSRRIAATHQQPPTQTHQIDWPEVQKNDPIIGEIYRLVETGDSAPNPESISGCCSEMKSLCAQLERMKLRTDGTLCRTFTDTNTGHTHEQIVVPAPLRKDIADELHRGLNGGHLGQRRSKLLLQKRFYWPHWSTDVQLAKHRCSQCARYQKPQPRRQGELQPLLTGEPWERIGIDVTGPHPTSSRGNVYILTIIDHFTKWVELLPMRNQEATTVAKLLFDRVICVHGCPLQILTDQGTNFESTLFQELCKLMSIDKVRTSTYKPSTNGNIERFHGTMHSMLAKFISDNQRDWDEKLPAVAFAYRTSVQESTKFTPFYLMYGREARIPADLVYGTQPDSDLTSNVSEFADKHQTALREAYTLVRKHLGVAARRRKRDYDLRTRTKDYPVGSWVWVYVPRRKVGRYPKWQSPYQGPFLVTQQLGPVNYSVQRGPKTKPWVVHVDKLKPCCNLEKDNRQTTDPDSDSPTSRTPKQAFPESQGSTLAPAERPRRHIRRPARFL